GRPGRAPQVLAHLGLAVTAANVAHSGLTTCAAWLARERLETPLACRDDRVVQTGVHYHVQARRH
ncbi:MAG: hypothetical protein KKC18_00835, partial [Chloroflexi bacterium]|nr:hypothetical protein [Chloroflexota bacterium]